MSHPESLTSSASATPLGTFEPRHQRTHGCGEVTPQQVGQSVTFNGWVAVNRDLGGITFVELRDRTGLVQLVADPQRNPQVHAVLGSLRAEAVIVATGTLTQRPADTVNANHPTGTLELYPTEVVVLNRAKPLPFQLDEAEQVDEAVRLKYRYLDLRRPAMYQKLALRHQLAQAMRHYLNGHQFLEIETPMLIRTTPEGARDYLVPSRVHAGSTYALPQSPQLFKQILMIAGCERYYQLARCFRDEDLRADRQPEFTQIDIEMAFVSQEDVLKTMEGLVVALLACGNVHVATPFKRMAWKEAMLTYGSDKPDLRYDLKFTNLTPAFGQSTFAVFAEPAQQGGVVLALRVPGAGTYSRKELDDLQAQARQWGAKGLAYILVEEEGLKSPILKYFSEAEQAAVVQQTGAVAGDAVFFMADVDWVKACDVLGRFRILFAKKHELIDPNRHEVVWVLDFPLFEKDPETGALASCHHPFTSPAPEDLHLLATAPETVRALAYDLAYNGAEIGGGSIRIHNPQLQQQVLDLLGLDAELAEQQFGFLLEALRYGAPPMGGIAFGLDRLAQMLTGAESIREVIAFPKNNQAQCVMTQAPVPPSPAQLKELHMAWALPPTTAPKA
jgi:aspartyl-tRNA synthetase